MTPVRETRGPANLIAHKQEKNAVFYLPPGQYTLKASANEMQTRQNFTLKAGELQNHSLLLNSGQISFESRLAPNSPRAP